MNRTATPNPTSIQTTLISDLHMNDGAVSVSTIAAVVYVALPMLVITLIYSKILYIAISSRRNRLDLGTDLFYVKLQANDRFNQSLITASTFKFNPIIISPLTILCPYFSRESVMMYEFAVCDIAS